MCIEQQQSTNFKAAYDHFKRGSIVIDQLKLLPKNAAILLLLILKRIFGLFVQKLKEYSNIKITICLSLNIATYHIAQNFDGWGKIFDELDKFVKLFVYVGN